MKKFFKKQSVALVTLGLVFLFALFLHIFAPVQYRTILAHETLIHAEIAATSDARQKGLSGREALGAHDGMLFLFPLANRYPFWMIDMRFPIDIIWIRGRSVVDIAANAQPPAPGTSAAEFPLYYPRLPADKVLEIPAGAAEQMGIKIGDELHGI